MVNGAIVGGGGRCGWGGIGTTGESLTSSKDVISRRKAESKSRAFETSRIELRAWMGSRAVRLLANPTVYLNHGSTDALDMRFVQNKSIHAHIEHEEPNNDDRRRMTECFSRSFHHLIKGLTYLPSSVVWSTYIMTDSASFFALAKLSDASGNDVSCGDKICPNNNGLMVLWPPLLLLHLGGQDIISVHSIEDVSLWLRYALGVVLDAGLTVYLLLIIINKVYFI
ncbi:hypothetical protein LguiA_011075 [Lonicera macranthoides]